MDTPDELRTALQALEDNAWAASALACAAEAKLLASLAVPATADEIAARHALSPALVRALLDVLVAVKFVARDGDRYVATPGLAPFVDGAGRDFLICDTRSALLQSANMVDAAKRGTLATGWNHTDIDILHAQGRQSNNAFDAIVQRLLPNLDGLLDRLRAPGGCFLDVGTGVAAFAIAFVRAFPELRAVGLEPAPAPLAEARRNVAAAGLADRIDLRACTVEDLADEAAFDFAWLPQMFLPDDVFASGLRAVHRALRPGGWLLTAAISVPGDTLAAAAGRLRNTLWGGGARTADEVRGFVERAGYERVMLLPGPRATGPIVARRAL